jgi:CheY-like chemotaxis protein
MKPLRILVVEDDALIGMLLGEVLVGMGHEVCAIEANEADAVAAAARCRPDLMIVDARLGDESGIAAVAQILCTAPVPYMFISGDPASVRLLRPDAGLFKSPSVNQISRWRCSSIAAAAACEAERPCEGH